MSDKIKIGYLRYTCSEDEKSKGPLYYGQLNGVPTYFRPSSGAMESIAEGKKPVITSATREDRQTFTVRKPAAKAMTLMYYRKQADGDGDNFAVVAGILPRLNKPSHSV